MKKEKRKNIQAVMGYDDLLDENQFLKDNLLNALMQLNQYKDQFIYALEEELDNE